MKVGTPYLYQFQSPSFDVPLPLGNASHIVVDEETLRSDSEDKTICYSANSRDQLRYRNFGECVVE